VALGDLHPGRVLGDDLENSSTPDANDTSPDVKNTARVPALSPAWNPAKNSATPPPSAQAARTMTATRILAWDECQDVGAEDWLVVRDGQPSGKELRPAGASFFPAGEDVGELLADELYEVRVLSQPGTARAVGREQRHPLA